MSRSAQPVFPPTFHGEDRVLLLAYYYLPINTSGVQRATRFVKYLPGENYRPYVICSSENGDAPGLRDVAHVPGPPSRGRAAAVSSFVARVVERVALPYRERLPWAAHAVAAALAFLSGERAAAVISTSPPVGTHIAAYFLKRLRGLAWIADFRDPILGNPGRARRFARFYDAALQRWIFRNADVVLAVTDTMAEEWRAKYPRYASKIHVLWNGFDPEEPIGPRPIAPRPYRTLAHVGVLYHQRHPVAMVESLERLLARGAVDAAGLRLRFIGPAADEPGFRATPAAASLAARGVLEIRNELLPRQEAIEEIATADYLLLIDIVNLLSNAGYTVPAKLYEYLRIGRPILAITAKGSPVERILAQSGIPHACLHPDDRPDEADRKLARFLTLPADPVAPSDWFVRHFDGRRQVARLAELLRSAPQPASRQSA